MNKDSIYLVFLTYEFSNSSYFQTTQLPLLKKLSGSGILVKAVRVVRSNSAILPRESREVQEGVHITTFLLQRKTLSIINLRTLFLIRHELRNEKVRSHTSILWYRSILPSLMLLLFRVKRPSHFDYFVYDSDGLAADENREYRSRRKFHFRYYFERALEKWAVLSASIVLVRSKETIRVLKSRYKYKGDKIFLELINARDSNMFKVENESSRVRKRKALGISKKSFVVVYAGSVGIQYMTEAMFQIYQEISVSILDSTFLLLVPREFHTGLTLTANRLGIPNSSFKLIEVSPDEMSSFLNLADVGLSLRHAGESMRHVRPLKSREYLLCGVPLVYTSTTGDSNVFPRQIALELDFESFAPYQDLNQWINDEIIPNREKLRKTCRDFAISKFNLELEAANLMKVLNRLPDKL